jgi:Flp pilus assembly protein TadD
MFANPPDQDLARADARLAINPSDVFAWFDRADALARLGRLSDAIDAHSKVLQLSPDEPASIAGIGFCLAALKQYDEALKAYDAVLKLLPGQPAIMFNRGGCLQKLGRHAEALAAFDHCLAVQPNDREVQIQRAMALYGLDRLEEALGAIEGADPEGARVEALANRALILLALGKAEAAREVLDVAVARGSTEQQVSLRYHRGLAALHAHDFDRAWHDYEHRWAAGLVDPPALDRGEPAWDGARVGTLRVWREQPIGDEVLLSRLVPLLKCRADKVVLECSPRLAPLFARSFQGVEVRPQGEAPERADAQVSIASLGAVLGVRKADLNDGAAFLKADPTKVAAIRARYEVMARGRPIVGISWFSNNKRIGEQKSAPLTEWRAFLAQDLLFVSLQYGPAAHDAVAAQEAFGCEIVTDADIDQLADLDAFAAQVRAMDHIVSVSNTTVHFAGALGVPCTVVLGSGRGQLWYWGCEGDTTPWYDSVRISRRQRAQHWAEQISAVAGSLKPRLRPAAR